MEDLKNCYQCEEEFDIDDLTEINDEFYCEDCLTELFTWCDLCEEYVNSEDTITYNNGNGIACNHCASRTLYYCRDCEEYFTNGHSIDNGEELCRECAHNYSTCTSCDTWIHDDNVLFHHDDPYCEYCIDDVQQNESIKDYSFKPDQLNFNKLQNDVNYFFGIELEIDGAGEDNDNAQTIINLDSDNIYCKHDGSLNDGFEIISHPCTPSYHYQEFPWQEILSEAKSMNYTSHDSGTCGMHIHISRSAFGQNQELNIAKLLYIFEKFSDNIIKFSRRDNLHYAQTYDLDLNNDLLDNYNYACRAGRYHTINLNNHHTVEIRIFRGTLNYDTFIANIQFTDLLIKLVNTLDVDDIKNLTWQQITESASEYKELTSYLESRNLLNMKGEFAICA